MDNSPIHVDKYNCLATSHHYPLSDDVLIKATEHEKKMDALCNRRMTKDKNLHCHAYYAIVGKKQYIKSVFHCKSTLLFYYNSIQNEMTSSNKTIPFTQSALQCVEVGGNNPFKWTTSAPVLQPSELGDNQVLLRNRAVSLNPTDAKMGTLNFVKAILPAVPGYDVSGEVVAVGNGVKDLIVGNDVFGFLNMNPNGEGGAFQQYSVADVDRIVKKPPGLSHPNAATLGIGFLSAMVRCFFLYIRIIQHLGTFLL